VYNEEAQLRANVERVERYVRSALLHTTTIEIVDNGSTDGTEIIGRELARTIPSVKFSRINIPGRGGAILHSWSNATEDIVGYMDIDLSTDLVHLNDVLQMLDSGVIDVAVGSRLAKGAVVQRGFKREILSRMYSALLHCSLDLCVLDAQCGFKFASRNAISKVLPSIRDREWFFDTEMIVVAHRAGLRLVEMPVKWTDDPGTTVRLGSAIVKNLLGIMRMMRRW
jgi:glycosyltransferase involved in cell wall biosynthesis